MKNKNKEKSETIKSSALYSILIIFIRPKKLSKSF